MCSILLRAETMADAAAADATCASMGRAAATVATAVTTVTAAAVAAVAAVAKLSASNPPPSPHRPLPKLIFSRPVSLSPLFSLVLALSLSCSDDGRAVIMPMRVAKNGASIPRGGRLDLGAAGVTIAKKPGLFGAAQPSANEERFQGLF